MVDRNSQRAETAPPATLQFVNITANVSEEERMHHQRMVRSAAMKAFRQVQKKERSKEQHVHRLNSTNSPKANKGTQNQRKEINSSSENEQLQSNKSISPNHSTPTSSTASEKALESLDAQTNQEISSDMNEETGALMLRYYSQSSPNLLGAGRADPFFRYPLDAGQEAGFFIDHSLKSLWPGLHPDNARFSLAASWHQKVRERPLVLHAMLYGAAVHLDALRSPHILMNPIRIYHKLRTIELLRQELSKPISDQTPLDDIILGVLTLGTSDIDAIDTGNSGLRSPFNSPISSIQWAHIYGNMKHIKEHTSAMRILIAKRGGLEKIQLGGLAEILSFSDILGATQNLEHPKSPPLRRTLDQLARTPPFQCRKCTQNRQMGKAFFYLQPSILTKEAVAVFISMAELIKTIDHVFRGCESQRNDSDIIDRKNAIQYRLMALPTSAELVKDEVESQALYECTRWAAITYSVGVTFPMHPISGLFPRLAELLKSNLSSILPMTKVSTYMNRLLVWILMLASITALETPLRTWFIQQLCVVVEKLLIKTWDEAVEVLRSFLWIDCACEDAGRGVWVEVLQMRARPLANTESRLFKAK